MEWYCIFRAQNYFLDLMKSLLSLGGKRIFPVLLCCRAWPAASHQPPKEPAGPAAVPPGTLPPLQPGHVHQHLPQTLSPQRHHVGWSSPQVRISLPSSTCTKVTITVFTPVWIKEALFFPSEGRLWILWPTAVQVTASGTLTLTDDSFIQDWFPGVASDCLLSEERGGGGDDGSAAASAMFENTGLAVGPYGTVLCVLRHKRSSNHTDFFLNALFEFYEIIFFIIQSSIFYDWMECVCLMSAYNLKSQASKCENHSTAAVCVWT